MSSTQYPKLIFGIDFGTTFSGISYTRSDIPRGLATVCNWENALESGNSELAKAPSRIAYPQDPLTATSDLLSEVDYFSDDHEQRESYEGDGNGKKITWGYGISPARLSGGTADCVEWFKLLLLDDDDAGDSILRTMRLTRSRALIRALEKEPIHVVADYLSFQWKHALVCAERHLGKKEINDLPFVVVLTVPAIWKSYTRSRMCAAAKEAGILSPRRAGETVLHFITEPEAGTVATISDMRLSCAEVGETFVVIDAGGGTVDLISYEITKTEPFTVKEIVEGEGALCGAIFLDEAFEDLLRSKVGEDNVSRIPKHEWTRMMDAWESGPKKQFVQSRRVWSIDLIGAAVQVMGRRNIILSGAELQTVFDSVMPKIDEMVNHQIQGVKDCTGKPPTRLILIGGFGQCKHLYHRMKALVEGESTEVFQAPGQGPWTAISRGAVMSAMQGMLSENFARIESRISRANYGLSFMAIWVEGEYELRDKVWCSITQRYYANHQMDWFLRKGENSSEKQPVRIYRVQHYRLSEPLSYPNLAAAIWVYDEHSPPSRRDETTVRKLCEIEFTATTSFEELPIETNNVGATYRIFAYEFHISSYGSSADIVVYANGERLGAKNLTIDYDVNTNQYMSHQREWRSLSSASRSKKDDPLASHNGMNETATRPPPYADLVGPQPASDGSGIRSMAIRTSAALRKSGIAERLGSPS